MKSANIYATVYDQKFDVTYDCPGLCQFALCEMMPPQEDATCTFKEYGSCRNHVAQIASLESLIGKLKQELSRMNEATE